MRERARNFLQSQVAALGNTQRARQHLRRILEHAQHLVAVLDKKLVALELHPVRVLDGLPRLNAQHHILRMRIVFAQIVAVVGRDQRQPKIFLQLEQPRMDAVFHLQSLILNLEEKIFFAKKFAVKSCRRSRRFVVPFRQPLRHFAFQAARKPDQPFECSARNFLLTRGL